MASPSVRDAARRAAPDDGVPDAPVRRRAETWLAVAGMVGAAVFLGGFALVLNRTDEETFLARLYPAMTDAGVDLASADAYDAARTLAAWFGLTLVVVLLVAAAGVYVARRRPARRSTGWWFLAAGLACLLGSQLVLYPVAFLFFLAAGLFALRRTRPTGPLTGPLTETLPDTGSTP
ncbi:hypothetical protein [Isoptericola sp. NPDC057653]|uniref:hypothetical protein n=1 Tax=Isoptericola sp. NPDC057653 TaxID=3346195 RepID=UPI0036C5CE23